MGNPWQRPGWEGHSAGSSTKLASRSSEKAVERHWEDEALVGTKVNCQIHHSVPKVPARSPQSRGFWHKASSLSALLPSFFLPFLPIWPLFKACPHRDFPPSALENHILKLRLYRWGLRYTKTTTAGGRGRWGTRPWGYSRPLSGLVGGLPGISVAEGVLSQHPLFAFLGGS